MTDVAIEKIVENTVKITIERLKLDGLLKNDFVSSVQKTDTLLKAYPAIKQGKSVDGTSEKFINFVDNAIDTLKNDIYYEIIPMLYFEGKTREDVAEYFDTSVTTISRHKAQLIDKLRLILFSDDAIMELLQ